ncbi:unnamed protein product [Cuscuta campestris]|uniref:Uncharacterized protein n=1 Tax=Cuscuta campestris TaxID=132261 RepID=A0A484LMS2_9ASTE|nr:unnamed protein product [Cuscuta campestris]
MDKHRSEEGKSGDSDVFIAILPEKKNSNQVNDNVDSVQGNVVKMKVKRNGVTSTQLGELFEGVDFDDWPPVGDQQVAQADSVVDDSHIEKANEEEIHCTQLMASIVAL